MRRVNVELSELDEKHQWCFAARSASYTFEQKPQVCLCVILTFGMLYAVAARSCVVFALINWMWFTACYLGGRDYEYFACCAVMIWSFDYLSVGCASNLSDLGRIHDVRVVRSMKTVWSNRLVGYLWLIHVILLTPTTSIHTCTNNYNLNINNNIWKIIHFTDGRILFGSRPHW